MAERGTDYIVLIKLLMLKMEHLYHYLNIVHVMNEVLVHRSGIYYSLLCILGFVFLSQK